ncbi:MAG: EF-hand domain-containing protein [Bryobacteraceae bacterium]
MRISLMTTFAVLAAASGLLAQNPTWAEQLHKTKTGIWPAGVEARLKAEKQAREQKPKVQAADLFALLDHNRDGVISAGEWQKATLSENTEPATNR